MNRPPRGFTIVELVIVLVIGSILTSIALASYSNARGHFAVRGARNAFVSLQARARAQAIEEGEVTWLVADVSGDSAYLSRNDTVLERIHFDDEFHVDLQSSTGNLRLCMTPRGVADTSCNSFSSAATLQFWQNADSCSVQVLPLGQLRW